MDAKKERVTTPHNPAMFTFFAPASTFLPPILFSQREQKMFIMGSFHVTFCPSFSFHDEKKQPSRMYLSTKSAAPTTPQKALKRTPFCFRCTFLDNKYYLKPFAPCCTYYISLQCGRTNKQLARAQALKYFKLTTRLRGSMVLCQRQPSLFFSHRLVNYILDISKERARENYFW